MCSASSFWLTLLESRITLQIIPVQLTKPDFPILSLGTDQRKRQVSPSASECKQFKGRSSSSTIAQPSIYSKKDGLVLSSMNRRMRNAYCKPDGCGIRLCYHSGGEIRSVIKLSKSKVTYAQQQGNILFMIWAESPFSIQ